MTDEKKIPKMGNGKREIYFPGDFHNEHDNFDGDDPHSHDSK